MNAPATIKPATRGQGETSGRYPHVVARLNDHWRVIVCRNDLQWILQRHDGQRGGTSRRTGVRYFLTRKALIALCRTSCGAVDPTAWATLQALPKNFRGGRGDG